MQQESIHLFTRSFKHFILWLFGVTMLSIVAQAFIGLLAINDASYTLTTTDPMKLVKHCKIDKHKKYDFVEDVHYGIMYQVFSHFAPVEWNTSLHCTTIFKLNPELTEVWNTYKVENR